MAKEVTVNDLTDKDMLEVIQTAKKYVRALQVGNGADAFPVPKRTALLMSLAVLKLHGEGKPTENQVEAAVKQAAKSVTKKAVKKPAGKTEKAVAKNIGKAVKKKVDTAAPLSAEQSKALECAKELVASKKVITTRAVAERGGWKSHNTGARHIKSLVDLGYLKKVGKKGVLALTELAA